jgi:hypothetical protein
VPVCAKVATPDWKALFESADAIALVRVDRIQQHVGVRTAVATVLEPVRGLRTGQQVAYVADPGWFWACDDSNARNGETALVLFSPITTQGHWRDVKLLQAAVGKRFGDRAPLFAIAWHGWGRFQATRRPSAWWVTEPPYRNPRPSSSRGRRGPCR